MNQIGKTIPKSRQDKRQITAYLTPKLVEAAHKKARNDGKSIQEVVGEAINAALDVFGYTDPIISVSHDRIVRRSKGVAKIRNAETVPMCRMGKRAVSGWFNRDEVEAVDKLAGQLGQPMQKLVEMGMEQITGSFDHKLVRAEGH
jgi:hypothetical protein